MALIVALGTIAPSVGTVVLAGAAGTVLLLWIGAEPGSRVPLRAQLEPALVPGLGVAVAIAVLFFLPSGTGGQEGLAALAVVLAFGLAAWLYLRSAAETVEPSPSP